MRFDKFVLHQLLLKRKEAKRQVLFHDALNKARLVSASSWFYTAKDKAGDAEIKAEIMKNRQFPECQCLQRLRTNYFSDNICGKAALCYWEIWNYKKVKAKAKGVDYEGNEDCDRYLTQSYACLIGYPKPRKNKPICDWAVVTCNKALAKLLYEDCATLRDSRQLPKPESIPTTLSVDDMNLDLREDETTNFLPGPTSNHFYTLSCPIVFRFPYFTIDLLFKEWDPNIVYDETTGLRAVAHMLPRFLREGINTERVDNFNALSLDQNLINWCDIPRNYICVKEEKDTDGKTLCNCNLCAHQRTCDVNANLTDDSGNPDCELIDQPENNAITEAGFACPNVALTRFFKRSAHLNWSFKMEEFLVVLLIYTSFIPSSSAWFYSKEDRRRDEDHKTEVMMNRHYPECNCVQRLRTNYFSDDDCGRAALCNWEVWNYKTMKAKFKGTTYNKKEEGCDKYFIQSMSCLIGYPKPQIQSELCDNAFVICMKKLSRLLYADCDEIRKERGLAKPQDVRTTLTLDDMNLDFREDETTTFLPTPSSDKPIVNHYYQMSCPVIFRFPYFAISLIFKHWDPNIIYDETTGLKEVAHYLPKFLRDGMNNDRIQNFDALALDPNLINWCNIPRNYICITEERDPDGKTLCSRNICPLQQECDPNAPVNIDDCDFNGMPG
ncbi:hypothetical protein Ocin01_16554 [Orchesella cincta]|uniref:Uncharacterized protein n=1 Tax=Orchesella cincta TaxID=48709 RepID=A0A1D2MB19_ORCCI|nr:hypothetical protein Ocin01_16554 [Orchesella cincta]